ncbi:MAG: amino acid ABC transporter permease [Erysipelotrichaceae bacterium]
MSLLQGLLPSLLDGAYITVCTFAITLALSMPLGLLGAHARLSNIKPLSAAMRCFIWLMRGTPLLLQLMVIFFGLPYFGIVLPRFPSAILAMVLNYTAYFAEIYRGGFLSVKKEQWEAGQVLGLSTWYTYRKIILPQMVKIVLPSLGNEIITLLKDTSLIYVLGIGELLRAGQNAANRMSSMVPFILVGIIYLILSAALGFVLRKVEARLR